MGLLETAKRYKAFIKSAQRANRGYWVVTFSCAPGVDMSVTVCDTGVSEERARHLATLALSTITGQETTS